MPPMRRGSRSFSTWFTITSGPTGITCPSIRPYYFEHEDVTPWGDAINFGREHCEPVRELFRANIRYWMDEFHIDGFRLDATHAICDATEPHILAELAEIVQSRGGYIMAEDERNDAKLLNPTTEGGYGMDGMWADDFHHVIESALTDASRYQEDFRANSGVGRRLQHGWTYRGKSARIPERRKERCASISPRSGLSSASPITTRWAIAPSGKAASSHHPREIYRAASALLLLAPYTPLLFMGQEWAASTPFYTLRITTRNSVAGRRRTRARMQVCGFRERNGTGPSPLRRRFRRLKIEARLGGSRIQAHTREPSRSIANSCGSGRNISFRPLHAAELLLPRCSPGCSP